VNNTNNQPSQNYYSGNNNVSINTPYGAQPLNQIVPPQGIMPNPYYMQPMVNHPGYGYVQGQPPVMAHPQMAMYQAQQPIIGQGVNMGPQIPGQSGVNPPGWGGMMEQNIAGGAFDLKTSQDYAMLRSQIDNMYNPSEGGDGGNYEMLEEGEQKK